MARKKKIPSSVVDYEALSNELKRIYNKFADEFAHNNIYALRERASEMGVESPTTLSKDDLVKRMTDRLICSYFPLDIGKETHAFETFRDGTGDRVEGLFEPLSDEYRIGRVLVPGALVKENKLRAGDLVKGIATDYAGNKTLTVVNSVEGELPRSDRRCFSDLKAGERRHLGTLIKGTDADALFPNLEAGERVIIGNMSRKTANDILASFPHSVGLFVGVEPECEAELQGSFVIKFDSTKEEALRIAYLALERAKRLCEWGKDVAFVVHGFDGLGDRDAERALFGVGRCFDVGSVTVIADVNKEKDYGIFLKIATRIID